MKMTKKCELCKSEAKAYCESDRARLCWDCDARVHGANFLVAKHSRTLLCGACHSLTAWIASGPALSPTVSVCRNCLSGQRRRDSEEEDCDDDRESDEIEFEDEEDEDEEEDEEEDDGCTEEDEDEENQVVPWSEPSLPSSGRRSNDSVFRRQASSSVSDTAFSSRGR